MFINKRETQSRRCTIISSSIAVCWADLVVLSIVLFVLVYIFIGVPLTARLCKMLKGRRWGYSRSSSTSSSIHHTSTRRSYSMSPRRVGSEETLLDGLVDVGYDKVDDALVHDPFLVVHPSLNDSVLVKQGLVEETALPLPVHSAHDIQVCSSFPVLPY
ncbi:hypothetical protein EDB84DRAFT_105271 [Lactarius hengduanensis]|nr:hypothetical protein EDB84DRAFT_105271 [Lactarius hengduanensis]